MELLESSEGLLGSSLLPSSHKSERNTTKATPGDVVPEDVIGVGDGIA